MFIEDVGAVVGLGMILIAVAGTTPEQEEKFKVGRKRFRRKAWEKMRREAAEEHGAAVPTRVSQAYYSDRR